MEDLDYSQQNFFKMQRLSMLQMPISDLGLSEGFNQMAACQHFRNLQDILNWPASVLIMHHNFTYHHYQELRAFLKVNNLIDLLRTAE